MHIYMYEECLHQPIFPACRRREVNSRKYPPQVIIVYFINKYYVFTELSAEPYAFNEVANRHDVRIFGHLHLAVHHNTPPLQRSQHQK